ncbi:MAG: NADH-quinone oxidoreductase subunit NuoB [Zetaproteobacteria bacterium]|nr:MAG: NADH-quinone oxidoreductase subunit NuoB [Zetaproteobacteria bacterium]
MLRLLRQIARVGTITEELRESDAYERAGRELAAMINKRFAGSLAIREVDAGSCNGCELEIHATNNAFYDIERFGVHFTASPRFADMLLVTGPVSVNMKTALEMTYEATPDPKLVVAIGDCAVNCGVFGRDNYAIAGAVSDIIPVDVVVHGCPPTPTDIIRGILAAIDGMP